MNGFDIAVAGHGNAVLGAFKLRLQIAKSLVGLEVGVVFCHHQQARQRAAELALGLLKALEGRRVVHQLGAGLDRGGTGAGLNHFAQGVLLKLGLAFDGAHQVGHQVRAALVLVQHLGPAGFDLFVAALQAVVAAAAQGQSQKYAQ